MNGTDAPFLWAPPGLCTFYPKIRFMAIDFLKSKITSSYDPSMYTLYMVFYRYMISAVQPVES